MWKRRPDTGGDSRTEVNRPLCKSGWTRLVDSFMAGDRRWLAVVCRWAIGILFLVSGIHKTISPADFRMSVITLPVIPPSLHVPVILTVPLLETACGLMLLSDLKPHLAALGVLAQLVAYTFTPTVSSLIAGEVRACGCLPVREPASIPYYLLRNCLLMLACLPVIAHRSPRKSDR